MKKLTAFFVTLIAAAAFILVPALFAGAAGNNLIPNGSVDTSANGTSPDGWSTKQTGKNTSTFTYLNSPAHSTPHSLQVTMTKTGGQAEWVFDNVKVAPNTKYTFTDWYQSSVQTHLQVISTNTNGKTSDLKDNNQAASSAWKQGSISFTTPKNAVSVTVYHYLDKVGQLITDDYDLEGPSVTAPTVSISSPVASASVSGTQTVTATTTAGSYKIKNVQFQLDGVNLGIADTTSPYSVSWDTTKSTNAPHNLTAVLNTTTAGVSAIAPPVQVNVNNTVAPTPPIVNITTPTNNVVLNGTQALTANATDAQGVTSVQFKLGSTNIGPALTTAPYTYSWDTKTVADSTYSITAVATNKAGLSATSAPVSVTVKNQSSGGGSGGTGTNLILNPSFENSANGTTPDSWVPTNWGANTPTFSYLNSGHTGIKSAEVQISGYANGAANWYYNEVPLTPGASYQYSNWYKSNVDTEVDAEVTVDGATTPSYFYLGTVPANTNWTQFKTTFTPPAGAKSMTIYQVLAKNGYIISDDYALSTYVPATFNRGIVSINFDDGWLSQLTNGVPALKNNGNLPATFFIITDSSITNPDPDYMSVTDIKTLMSDGYEIGNHTKTHPDLTTLTTAQIQDEMVGSQTVFQNALGVKPTDFAYPFGAYNANTIAIGKTAGFVSQRSVNAGFNSKDNLDLTQLKIEEVDADITPAQVQAWVDQAIAQKTWLILVYHETDTKAPAGSGDEAYLTSPTNLSTELSYIKNSGVAVETTAQAINEIQPQL